MCFSLFACLRRASNKHKTQSYQPVDNEKTYLLRPSTPPQQHMSPQQVADQILDLLFQAQHFQESKLNGATSSLASPSSDSSEPIRTTGWYSSIAQYILRGMEAAVRSGITVGEAMSTAVAKARAGAEEFVREHPIWAGVIVTVIALGALYLLVPWVIEALGFTEAGPLAGSWAASWQSSIGNVEAGSFFAFLQRLGMVGLHGATEL